MEAHPANLPAPTASRAGIRLPGVGAGLGGGTVVLYLSIIVLLPLAAVCQRSLRRRPRPLLGPGHLAAGGAIARTDHRLLADRRRHQRRSSARSSPGSWSATSSPARAAVNAVIDLPFALPTIVASLTLLALYGNDSPIGIDIAVDPGRGRRRAAVRHPALRRPRGAAAADRDGPRDGGGGRLARRRRLHDLPPHHLPQPAPRPRRRRSRWPSPAPSASSARC